MKSSIKRGKFIVFEGLDRCGKSTQCKMLFEKMSSNSKAIMLSFPSKHDQGIDRKNITGALISEYLSCKKPLHDKSIHLLFSANRWEDLQEIQSLEKLLKTHYNKELIQYAIDTVSQESLIQLPKQYLIYLQGLDPQWCKNSDKGLIVPDVVFYIDTALETICERKGFGQEKYQKKEFIEKVQEQYNEMIKENMTYWKIINGNRSVEQIAKHIQAEVDNLLQEENQMALSFTLFK